MTLAELISALEAASVGSDDLDRQIAAWRWSCPLPNAGIGRRYTRDINDALTLVPENCPVDLHIGPYKTSNDATVYTKRVWLDEKNRRCTTYDPHEAKCVRDGTLNWNTPALALCIAALRTHLHPQNSAG